MVSPKSADLAGEEDTSQAQENFTEVVEAQVREEAEERARTEAQAQAAGQGQEQEGQAPLGVHTIAAGLSNLPSWPTLSGAGPWGSR